MELTLAIAGVQLGAFLIIFVQALKFLGVTEEKWLRLGPVVAAVAFGAVYAVELFVPASKPIVDIVFQIIVAVMTAVLGYNYVAKPVAEAFGLKVSSGDIEE
jgi:hypothetical protein